MRPRTWRKIADLNVRLKRAGLPFGLPNVFYSEQDGMWNLEWRVWKRWFIEAEGKIELMNWPTASDLVGTMLADEAEDFLREGDDG